MSPRWPHSARLWLLAWLLLAQGLPWCAPKSAMPQCHESKWKSIGHIACVLWDVDEEITSFSLRLRHAFTCEKRAAKGKNGMPNIYRIYLYLNNSKVLKVLVLSILYHILIFSETCRGPFPHSAKSQLSYTPSLPSIKAVEPVKGCCVT